MCIADRIRLYINSALDNLKANLASGRVRESEWIEIRKQVDALYNELRGDIFVNGKHPKTLAAAIVYIGVIIADAYINQTDIANAIACTPASIRIMYEQVAIYLRLITDPDRVQHYNRWHNPKIREVAYVPPKS